MNNPTDKDMTVTLKKNMDLPCFKFDIKNLTVKAGEVLDINEN